MTASNWLAILCHGCLGTMPRFGAIPGVMVGNSASWMTTNSILLAIRLPTKCANRVWISVSGIGSCCQVR